MSVKSHQSSSTKRRARIVSKTDTLLLHRPHSKRHPTIAVSVVVEGGSVHILSLQRKMFKVSVNVVHDLKTVWINDLLDDECSDIRNCFAILTPENSYILQATNHRMKIEWMQAVSVAVSQSLKFRGSYRPSNWSKLDDLRKWLSVREVEFQYETNPLYKGAVYTGKWNLGMPHICGSMKWPNGDYYEGEFMFGKFNGTGTMMWLSHGTRRSYTGSWRDGVMEGLGEMTYSDHSVYTGWWHIGKRCGHGRVDLPLGRGSYTGSWEADKRNGYGVFDNVAKCERYFGMWRNDKQNGPGILVAQNKFCYSGNYDNGEKKLFGNRDSVYVNQDDKWSPLFQACSALLEQMVSVSHSRSETGSQSDGGSSDTDSAVAMDFSDIGASPDMESSCRTCHGSIREDEECVVCRVEGFKSTDHPLGMLVNIVTRCFNESYSDIGCHDNLLSHAVGELCSITTRLHHIVKIHCPSLITTNEDDLMGKPKSQLSLLLRSRKVNKRASQKNTFGADPSWLHPILLPSIFKTLFSLYNEHNREENKKINDKMTALSPRSDEELCHILGIHSLYLDCVGLDSETSSFTSWCDSTVQILQRISQFSTPQNKLMCASEANEEMVKLLDEIKSRADSTTTDQGVSSDEANVSDEGSPESQAKRKSVPTGLFTLVVIKARLENLSSEIQFIQDFAGSHLMAGKDGFLLGKLQDCHFLLQEAHDSVNSSDTLFASNRERLVTYVRI